MILGVCSWNLEKQLWCLRRRHFVSGSAWWRRDGDGYFSYSICCWSRQGKAWAEMLPSSATGHVWLPNWLSLRLLFIQIRQGSGSADRLRFLSHAYRLSHLIFELQTQRYSFGMGHFCGVRGDPGVTVSKAFSCSFGECGYVWFVWPSSSETSSRDAFVQISLHLILYQNNLQSQTLPNTGL